MNEPGSDLKKRLADLVASGSGDEAATLAREAAKQGGIREREIEAFLLNQLMRWNAALKVWDGVIDGLDESERPNARMAKSLALAGAGRVDEALALAAEAAEQLPALRPIQIGLLVDMKRPEEALRVAAALETRDPGVLHHVARAHLATGNPLDAAEAAGQSLADGEHRAAPVLGAALASLGPERAEAWAHRAAAWLAVGAAGTVVVRSLLDAGRVDDARIVGRAFAATGEPNDNPAAWVPHIVASHAAGDFDAMYRACGQVFARGLLNAGIARVLLELRHPLVVQAALYIGARYTSEGKLDPAEVLIGFAIDAALALDPPSNELLARGWWEFAGIIGRRGLHEKSALAFRKAAELYAAADRPVWAAHSQIDEAAAWRALQRLDEADDAVRRADANLPPPPDRDRFDLALEAAHIAMARGDRATAEAALAGARAMADALSLDEPRRARLADVAAKLATPEA